MTRTIKLDIHGREIDDPPLNTEEPPWGWNAVPLWRCKECGLVSDHPEEIWSEKCGHWHPLGDVPVGFRDIRPETAAGKGEKSE